MTKRKAPKDRKALGAPTKYRKAFCAKLIAHMAAGNSFESFAGVVGVADQTIRNWAEQYPDFLEAKERAWAKSREWWESLGIQGVQGFGPEMLKKRKVTTIDARDEEGVRVEVPAEELEYGAAKVDSTLYMFIMCNRFPNEWRQRHEMTGPNGGPILFAEDQEKLHAPDTAKRQKALGHLAAATVARAEAARVKEL